MDATSPQTQLPPPPPQMSGTRGPYKCRGCGSADKVNGQCTTQQCALDRQYARDTGQNVTDIWKARKAKERADAAAAQAGRFDLLVQEDLPDVEELAAMYLPPPGLDPSVVSTHPTLPTSPVQQVDLQQYLQTVTLHMEQAAKDREQAELLMKAAKEQAAKDREQAELLMQAAKEQAAKDREQAKLLMQAAKEQAAKDRKETALQAERDRKETALLVEAAKEQAERDRKETALLVEAAKELLEDAKHNCDRAKSLFELAKSEAADTWGKAHRERNELLKEGREQVQKLLDDTKTWLKEARKRPIPTGEDDGRTKRVRSPVPSSPSSPPASPLVDDTNDLNI